MNDNPEQSGRLALAALANAARLKGNGKVYSYTRDAREEHNLIARAIALGHVMNPNPPALVTSEPRQLAPHDLSASLVMTYQQRQTKLNDLVRFAERLAKNPDAFDVLALQQHVHEIRHASTAHRRARGAYERARVPGENHAIGTTYFIDTPGDGRLHFELDLRRTLTPPDRDALRVMNAAEVEDVTGISAGGQAWEDLARWAGLNNGRAWVGRPLGDDTTLIWRNDRGSLVMRSHVERDYPRLHCALEALRHTLNPFWEPDT